MRFREPQRVVPRPVLVAMPLFVTFQDQRDEERESLLESGRPEGVCV